MNCWASFAQCLGRAVRIPSSGPGPDEARLDGNSAGTSGETTSLCSGPAADFEDPLCTTRRNSAVDRISPPPSIALHIFIHIVAKFVMENSRDGGVGVFKERVPDSRLVTVFTDPVATATSRRRAGRFEVPYNINTVDPVSLLEPTTENTASFLPLLFHGPPHHRSNRDHTINTRPLSATAWLNSILPLLPSSTRITHLRRLHRTPFHVDKSCGVPALFDSP
ncbi:hypothetical protein QBC43DRAFT_297885 [Cladorrhinum sp. PSN259]|nr:hypothetical protein QBC43DRAFT_297885 [Cladorrhinum sp. PSN259]